MTSLRSGALRIAAGLLAAAAAGALRAEAPAPSAGDAAALADWERSLQQRYAISRMQFVGRDERDGLPVGDFFIYGNLDLLDRASWWTRLLRALGLAPPPPPALREDPDAQARQFLERESELLGRATWQLEMNEEHRRGRRKLRYQSYVGALRVDKAEVNVHISTEGFISAVTGHVVRLPAHLPNYLMDRQQSGRIGSISQAEAARSAARDLGLRRGHLGVVAAERRVVPERPFVVWRLEVTDRRQKGRNYVYLIDERNGDVLERRQILRF